MRKDINAEGLRIWNPKNRKYRILDPNNRRFIMASSDDFDEIEDKAIELAKRHPYQDVIVRNKLDEIEISFNGKTLADYLCRGI